MHINRILRWVIVVGIFIIPFIPLVVAQSMFFPFITGKNFTFRVIVEIIFAAWLILSLRDPSARPRRSPILIALAAFLGIITLAGLFGINPERSFWSNFERMDGLITQFHLFAYFLVITAIFSVEKWWRRFFHVSLIVAVISSIYAIFQLAGVLTINQGGVRIDATFGNTIYFAVYMLFHVGLSLYYFSRAQIKKWYHYGYLGLAALFSIMVYYTATRGAILGLLGGGVLALILIAVRERGAIRKFSVGVLVGVLLLTGGFFLIRNSAFVQNSLTLARFANISFNDDATRARLINMQIAWKGFLERPILGWGTENYNIVFNKHYDPRLYAQEQWFDRVHNTLFDWLVGTGILGFVAYLSIFASALYVLWRKAGAAFSVLDKSVLTGLFAAYFLQNLFVFDNLLSYVMFFSILGYIHVRSKEEISVPDSLPVPSRLGSFFASRPWLSQAGVPVVIILFVVGFYFLSWEPIRANQTLIHALTGNGKGYEGSIEAFKQTIRYNTLGRTEAREQLVQAAVQVSRSTLPDQSKIAFFDLAKAEMDKELAHVPTTWKSLFGGEKPVLSNDARTYVIASALYRAFGLRQEALALINKALEFTPKKQQIISDKAVLLVQMGNLPEALTTAKIAFDLEPKSRLSRVTYAAALIYNGNIAEAERVLSEAYGTAIVAEEQILVAFMETGQFENARLIALARVAQDPNNMQFRLSLAAVYLELGRREDAIKELEEAIRIEPNFKAQGEHYISEIRAGRNP